MELEFTWILMGLPIAFAFGWMASRFDLRQMRLENQRVPKAYFRGLNFLLNEQQDEAIDAFIEAVQKDPDTTELHFALGNLFRRRGEYARAVRVHEHLLHRGDLKAPDRHRAQYALSLDYLKAGLLDRAEAALRMLEGTLYQEQAHHALLVIYERARDWEPASEVAGKLQSSGAGDFSTRQAHYLCELAAICEHQGDLEKTETLLLQAITVAPEAARPSLEWAQWLLRNDQPEKSLRTLQALGKNQPFSLPLGAGLLTQAAQACGKQQETLQWLESNYRSSPSLDLLEAIIALHTTERDAIGPTSSPNANTSKDTLIGYWNLQHLQQAPSLVAATQWLASQSYARPEDKEWIQKALQRASQPLTRYRCAACGFETKQHFWQCPGCQSWDSYPPKRVDEL